MKQFWFTLLYQPIVNFLVLLYRVLGNNLGLAIILLTVIVRLLVIPLMKPQLESSKKIQQLSPELEKLKKKYKDDKQKFVQAQMDLYKRAGVNPAGGCLPLIIQFLVLFALFQAFSQILKADGESAIEKLNQILYPFLQLPLSSAINLKFLWLDLSRPDIFSFGSLPSLPGIFVLLSALFQFVSAKMMMPYAELVKEKAKETETKTDDFSSAMQMQMTYMLPLMTFLAGYSFASGLVLYWLIFSVFSVIQQYSVGGWGGLTPQVRKVRVLFWKKV